MGDKAFRSRIKPAERSCYHIRNHQTWKERNRTSFHPETKQTVENGSLETPRKVVAFTHIRHNETHATPPVH